MQKTEMLRLIKKPLDICVSRLYNTDIIPVRGGDLLMDLLEQRIMSEGRVIGKDILKVDMFLNHRIDPALTDAMGAEFRRIFADKDITLVLTVEASGIPAAVACAREFGVPCLFAKKGRNRNVGPDVYSSEVFSFTKGETYIMTVAKAYLTSADRVLIIDDFIAEGAASTGLLDIIGQAGASCEGIGIIIEKAFQSGGAKLRAAGYDVRSLAVIEEMSEVPGGAPVIRFRHGC